MHQIPLQKDKKAKDYEHKYIIMDFHTYHQS